jgi:hypothetical protein
MENPMIEFNPGISKGMPAPVTFVDASGARFWGMQVQSKVVPYGFSVWRQAPNTAPVMIFHQASGQGTLCLQPSGMLEICELAASGDGVAVRVIPVPQWVPVKPSTPTGTLSARYTQALERLCKFLGI